MTREEAFEMYHERYQHKTFEKSRKFKSPGWKIIIMITRLIMFPVMLPVRIFKWTYYMD